MAVVFTWANYLATESLEELGIETVLILGGEMCLSVDGVDGMSVEGSGVENGVHVMEEVVAHDNMVRHQLFMEQSHCCGNYYRSLTLTLTLARTLIIIIILTSTLTLTLTLMVGICFTEIPGVEMIVIPACFHTFCGDCLTQFFKVHIKVTLTLTRIISLTLTLTPTPTLTVHNKDGSISQIKCPDPSCAAPVLPQCVKALVSEEEHYG